jgi:hypothetical protein
MKEGIIVTRGTSQKGKPTITINSGAGDELYYAGNTNLGTLGPGDKISFSATSFANGKLWGIDAGWKLLSASPKYPSPSAQPPVPAAPTASPAPSNGVQDAERPCVSNWGAELIKAGLIKKPDDLAAWVEAIKTALR